MSGWVATYATCRTERNASRKLVGVKRNIRNDGTHADAQLPHRPSDNSHEQRRPRIVDDHLLIVREAVSSSQLLLLRATESV